MGFGFWMCCYKDGFSLKVKLREREREREREKDLWRLAEEEAESSVALEWILRAAIISSFRRMFSRRFRSYSVSF